MNNSEQDFWTKEIVLEREISRNDFYSLRRSWGILNSNDQEDTYVRMLNPMAGRTYQELVARFLQHPCAKDIMVREAGFGRHWFKKDKISPRLTGFIAGLAADHEHQDGHFEMQFEPTDDSAEGIEQRARISFRKQGELLVGNEISLYRGNLDLFTSNIKGTPRLIVSAICSPKDVKY